MKFKRTTRIFISLVCTFGLIQSALADIYIVKIGDTVSRVLVERNLTPIYGRNGALAQVIALNPSLRKHNGNLIFPGMRLNLALDASALARSKSGARPKSSPTSDKSFARSEESPLVEAPLTESATAANDRIAPAEVKKEQNKVISHSDVGLTGVSEFMRVKASDPTSGADATLLSDASIGFRLTWGQTWNKKFRSYLSYQALKVNIQDSSSTTKTLTNKDNTLTSYLLGLEYKQTEKLMWSGALNYGETLVSRALNSTTITIEKFVLPTLQGGIAYTLYQVDDLSVQALGGLSVTMPTKHQSYDAKLSIGKKIGLGLSDSIGTFKIDGELYYLNTDLKMQDAGYDQSSIGILIGISKRFGSF